MVSSVNIRTGLQFTTDGRVKRSAIVFFLNPHGKFSDLVIRGGLQLSMSGILKTMKDHLIMSESRNQKNL